MARARKGRWNRQDFRRHLEQYLEPIDVAQPDLIHCNVTGKFLYTKSIKCAHIVPYAFQSVELDYLFGTEDSALCNVRNGLFMPKGFEQAWDDGKVTIVPCSSLDISPIEWKVVVLDETLLSKIFLESADGFWRYRVSMTSSVLGNLRLTFTQGYR